MSSALILFMRLGKPVGIKFIGCKETPVDPVYDNCLVMDLEGEKKEYAGLEGMHGSDMVFQGQLHDELGVEDLDSRVSVSINDDKKAAIVSQHRNTALNCE